MKNKDFFTILFLSFLSKGMLGLVLVAVFIGILISEIWIGIAVGVSVPIILLILSTIFYPNKPVAQWGIFHKRLTQFLTILSLIGFIGFWGSIFWGIFIEYIEIKIILMFLGIFIVGLTPFFRIYQETSKNKK